MVADLDEIPPHLEGMSVSSLEALLLVDHDLHPLEAVDDVYKHETASDHAFRTDPAGQSGA